MSETSDRRTARRLLAVTLLPLVAVLLVATTAGAVRSTSPGPVAVGAVSHSAAELGLNLRLASLHRGGRLVPRSILRLPARGATRATSAARATRATAAETPCGQTPGLLCSQVVVPLDRTGVVPGTIALHVERLPAVGVPRGTMYLIAGGPGQGSARAFDLASPDNADFYRFLFPGYTLVAYDDRGTGASGLLRCPALESAITTDQEASAVSACADGLGPSRAFYGTIDHAEDLEAVRVAIGADKVGLWGVSYGTKLAMAYALLHPDRVDRLLLDSVLPPELPDPYFSNVLRQMPATLTTFCAGGLCNGATPDLAGDVAAVANQVAAKPVSGTVLSLSGLKRTVRITGDDVLSVVVDADLNPGLAAELPAVMHEARLGDYRPLLRLAALDSSGAEDPADLSSALFAATTCRDGPFPWAPDSAVADRPAALQSGLAALPAGSLGPFGSWAARLGNATFCLTWPAPSGGVTYGTGALPNVPVLAISGGFDMRTPTESAAAIASRFPQGHVLLVPGVGHSTVTADPSFCAPRAVRAWILGSAVADQCPRAKPFLDTVPAFAPVKTAQPTPETVRQTLADATRTVREAEAIWLMTFGGTSSGAVAGLYSGRIVAAGSRAFTLVRYSIAPGIELSGKIRFTKFGPPLEFAGVVTVAGRTAASGVLGITGGRVGGTLGGEIVGS